MKSQQIVVDNKIYEVVATVHDDETNKDFVVFTDKNADISRGIPLSCTLYYEKDNNFIPIKITDAKDKETASILIKTVIKNLYSVSKNLDISKII